MGNRKRRSVGTVSGTDLLLRWTFIRRRTPEQDRADLDAGRTLVVISLSKTLGGESLIRVGKGKQIARLKSGHLHLSTTEPIAWEARTGADRRTVLAGPLELRGEGTKLPGGRKFAGYELVTGQGVFDLAIPRKDAELVRYALSLTGEKAAAR
jgi:hypothetical protein